MIKNDRPMKQPSKMHLRGEVNELRGLLRDLMAVIFRDGGQKAATFSSDREAAKAAMSEVGTLLARIEFLQEGKAVAIEKLNRLGA